MKRHPALIPLSMEHHLSLALCARILRAPDMNHSEEISKHLPDLEQHFRQEETQFTPLWASLPNEYLPLKQQFESDHHRLRELMVYPQYDQSEWNIEFATLLRDHARFEERQLFEVLTQFALPKAE